MQAPQLDAQAAANLRARKLIAELRELGVREADIRRCRTVGELEELNHDAVVSLMSAPERSAA